MRRSLQRNHSRLGVAKILFLAMFLAIAGRAFQLQVLQGERLMRLGRAATLEGMDRVAQTGRIVRPRR